MEGPISPPPARGSGRFELPAYLSNGLLGLRIPDVPLFGGYAMVSGFSGIHAEKKIEAAATAPYPCGGDLAIDGVEMSTTRGTISVEDQAYDFSCGELTSRFRFTASGIQADVTVLTFCSRTEPTIVCQETLISMDRDCVLTVSSAILTAGLLGHAAVTRKEEQGRGTPIDGLLRWTAPGGISACGLAHISRIEADCDIERRPDPNPEAVRTCYDCQARAGQQIRLVQLTSVLPDVMHRQPEMQAARLVAMNAELGFEALRERNRAAWAELWKGRIVLAGAGPQWQAMADAAFYYLNSSVHSSAPCSTSIFGLATEKNYHYYYGHVMWDIETFVVPVLSVTQPDAAAALLEYRFRTLDGAHHNARGHGLRGLQFPWEAAPSFGQEAAPLPGTAAWHEDHVSLDVALAFAFHAQVTGDRGFLRTRAWPVLSGVATWIESRVLKTARGYEIREVMGIAERKQSTDNSVFTNMSAILVLRQAIATGEALGEPVKPVWAEIADGLVLPERDGALVSFDGYKDGDEKADTPDPLMAIFPLGFPLSSECRERTLALFLAKAEHYIGSPMLSALYGVWAARSGDRSLAGRLMHEGYAAFVTDRFMQTLEYRHDRFPEQPMAGPFFANIGGFLMSLLLGFPGLFPDQGDPDAWRKEPVVLPEGWEAIQVERIWMRGRPMRLAARHGTICEIEPTDAVGGDASCAKPL